MGKGQIGILEALEKISQRFPFQILGIDSDNGSEFINHYQPPSLEMVREERNSVYSESSLQKRR